MIVTSDFYTNVLDIIGAPASANNIEILARWQAFEGGNAQWNPLNTTQGWQGATDYNSTGVKNYPDATAGEAATGATLRNGYYPQIVLALRGDWPLSQWNQPEILKEINTWGTHGFANYISQLGPQPTPAPTPHTLKENDNMLIQGAEGLTYWLVNGKLIHVDTPDTLKALQAAGIPMAVVSDVFITQVQQLFAS